MQRCFDLAIKGLGKTKSNPMVGAVLVYEDRIIGEGYHEIYGEEHAEVNCLKHVALSDQHLIAQATMYVSLEPCSFYGKTPPCSNLIIEHKIPKVVVACLDPNQLVAGKGISLLQDAGIEVILGVLAAEAEELNKRFFVNQIKKRPYIILKYALSANHFFCRADKQQQWLSSSASKRLVHQWRSEEMGILVGKNTVLMDDPALTVRLVEGTNPIRIILDRQLQLALSHQVFNANTTVIIVNQLQSKKDQHLIYCKANTLEELLHELYVLGISSILVEGGLEVIQNFIDLNVYDEVREIRSSSIIEEGLEAPTIPVAYSRREEVGTDTIFIYRNREAL